MKKITLLLLFLFISISGYSQLALEGFENFPGPDAPPATNWTLGTGNWAVFDNGVGTNVRWDINNTPTLVYNGVNAAYVNRENIGAGNTSEEYLATPPVQIPANGVLHFYTRMFTSGNQGTIYQIKVAPATASQTDPFAYSLVQQWTEDELIVPTSNFNVYTEKTVNLSAFATQFVYVSFVKVFTQPDGNLGGDRWLVDNVSIDAACLTPTALTVSTITSNSASLSWTNPNGTVNGWEVIATPSVGTPIVYPQYSGALPFIATGLSPNTTYTYQVRAICTTGFSSPWSAVSASFTTQVAPPVCGGNFVDSGGIAANYANNANVTTTICPTNPGDLVTVTFTSFNTENGVDLLKVYDGNSAAAPLLATLSGTALPSAYTASSASGCLTFVFTSNATTTAAGWASNVTCAPPPTCRKPTAVASNTITSNSAIITWTQPANPDTTIASAWQVLVLPCGSPAPTAGSTGFVSAPTNPFTLTGLTSATCYDIYVRAVCSVTDSSTWAGPTTLTTQLSPPVCGGNFVDTGGLAANYPNNANQTTTICPVNPGDVVTITFTSFNTQAGTDLLKIYDGNDATAPLLATLSGTTLPPSFTSSAATGCLTFVFTSNATTNAAGWVSNITCAAPPVCRNPTTLTSSAVLSSSVILNWIQPANPDTTVATSWNVLALPCGSPAPTAASTGFVTASTNPFTLTGLSPTTCYDIYIRAACSGVDFSTWTGPATITTQIAPPVCGGSFVDAAGPTTNYVNNSDSTVTICPVNVGDVVTVTFTSFNTEATYDALYVFNGNSITAPQIASANGAGNVPGGLAGGYWGTTIPGPFTSTSATGCLTFRFRSDDIINNPGWVANVTCAPPPTCIAPTAITNNTITSNSVILNWTQPVNPDTTVASAWQVLALPCGSPAPTAASTGFVNTSTNPFTLTGLSSATCYNIYIRAVCSLTDSSSWGGPTIITTQVAPPICGGNFVDAGGTAANYPNNSDSTVTICPINAGDVVTVTFTSFNTEATYDALYVFDGNSITAPQIASANGAGNVPGALAGGYWGTTIPGPFTSSSANGCLTFRFRSDGTLNNPGWVSNITCGPPPSCRIPTAITVAAITTNSAVLNWTQPINPDTSVASAWQVLVLPCGSPAPTAASTGFVDTSTNPFTITGLTTATCYEVYVRAVCSLSDSSSWSIKGSFITLISNDECSNAINVPVNADGSCNLTASGSVIGATASPQGNTCAGNDNDDVWFQFTATNTQQLISLINVAGSTTDLFHVLYSGSCGSLTQLYCSDANNSTATGLIVGQTYYIRVYSYSGTAQTTTFDVCIKSPVLPPSCTSNLPAGDTCATATPICNLNGYCGNTSAAYNIDVWPELETEFCAGSVDNDSFITFVASSSTVNLNLWVTNSQNGDGIQLMIFSTATCGSGPVTGYVCNNQILPTGSSPTTITATGLTPGNTYYMIIDGYAGDVCDYIIGIPSNGGISTQVSVTTSNNNVCLGGGVTLNATGGNGSYNWTVTPASTGLSATTGSTVTFTPTTTGAYIVTATSTDGNTVCPLSVSDAETINAFDPPAQPTYTATLSNCATSTGSITFTSPIASSPLPSDLFISEVTDADTGSLTYVELYNGTGAAVNLANYKLKFYTWGSPPTAENLACNLQLAGTIANNSTNVIKVSSDANASGVVPNQTFTGCGGVNNNDNIRLTTASDLEVDVWGVTDGSTFTPAGQTGYTYRRLNTAVVPSTTWNAAEWTALDPEVYTNVASYTSLVSNYQYSINNGGVFQASPVFSNLAPGPYTLVVKDMLSGCLSAPVNVTISGTSSVPTTFTPLIICNGDALTLPTTSLEGFTGTWLPATVDNTQTATYTFTPDASQCADTGTLTITVNQKVTATFNPITICNGDSVTFPTTSLEGFTGTWLPATVDNTQTATYTFTPDAGQCADIGTLTITVIQPTTPTFNPVTAICNGDTLSALPTTSLNGYTGNWSPTLNNTSTTTYTFTPDAGQCAGTGTLTITVIQPTTPTFNPVTAICNGDALSALPTTSLNGYTGNWSPTLNNTSTTTYTFTPDAGQCATTGTLTITVNQPTTPTFNSVTAICNGDTLSALPTTSLNGYTGTWSPTLNNTSTTTYTFTPDAGQCAGTATLTITVNQKVTATFNPIGPLCNGETTVPSLPTTSNEGFTGTWSPATINTVTTGTYIFTPDAGQCANSGNLTVTVLDGIDFVVTGGCQSVNYILTATPVDGSFVPETAIYSWHNAAGVEVGTTQSITVTEIGAYTVTITVDGCSTQSAPFDVTSVFCVIQKGISVNNDGLNDTFDLSGFDVKKLTIFNRLGMKVYSRNNYVNEWGGKDDDGDELPDGTYYFMIDRNSGDTKTGWIYINRAQ